VSGVWEGSGQGKKRSVSEQPKKRAVLTREREKETGVDDEVKRKSVSASGPSMFFTCSSVGDHL
jgi:hypothetical protein